MNIRVNGWCSDQTGACTIIKTVDPVSSEYTQCNQNLGYNRVCPTTKILPTTEIPTTQIVSTPKFTILNLTNATLIPNSNITNSTIANTSQLLQFGKLGVPVKATYIDYMDIDWADPTSGVKDAADAGFNMIILSFWTFSGVTDIVQIWVGATHPQQQSAIDYAHSKGAVVLLGVGGATETPYTTVTGITYGSTVASFVEAKLFDGVVFDFENFDAGLVDPVLKKSAIGWIIDCTNAARVKLGTNAIIAHAPQAPYFGPIGGSTMYWTGLNGGYSLINSRTQIDYYLVQFYNQGTYCYSTFDGLFRQSEYDCPGLPGTSVFEIASYGVPLYKIINGKCTTASDCSSGYITQTDLGRMHQQAATQLGWYAGTAGWQWRPEAPAWIAYSWPWSGANITNATIVVPQIASSQASSSGCSSINPCSGGACCSQYGFCGFTDNYCGTNCVAGCPSNITYGPGSDPYTIGSNPNLYPTNSPTSPNFGLSGSHSQNYNSTMNSNSTSTQFNNSTFGNYTGLNPTLIPTQNSSNPGSTDYPYQTPVPYKSAAHSVLNNNNNYLIMFSVTVLLVLLF
jgi:hypothetical protein